MRKRIILAAAIAALSLAGCSGSSDNTQTTAEITSSETTTAEVTTEAETESLTAEETTEVVELKTIKELFADYGMKAGTCITTKMIKTDKAEKIILDNFNSVTMENDMKPDYILNKEKSQKTGEIVIEFNNNVIEILDWARANDMAVRGHTLVWYSQTPDWIFYEDFDTTKAMVDRDTMLARMESLIKGTFDKLTELGYMDLFYAYDVVNEAWMENGSMRSNNWKQTIGDDYIWYAFYYANMYAPEGLDLYYNDYNEQYKTSTFEKFVKTLVDEDGNYLIDGIGFQAHLYTYDDLYSYFNTVDKIAALGIKVQLTELDVCLGSWQQTLTADEKNLAAQGTYYYNLIKGILERVEAGTLNSDALTFWGFTDLYSWRSEASPLLYDYKFQPKPAYYGVLQNLDMIGTAE